MISQYLAGDLESLEILIQKYLKSIYGFVYRYIGNPADAEDVTQEVFFKVWKSFKKFDQKRNFKTWLYSIAKNASIDYLRKKKNIPLSKFENEEGDNSIADNLADLAPLAPELFDRENLAEELNQAMEKLSSACREVIYLHYHDELDLAEIAEILGESVNTTKSRHRRALVELRKIIE